MKVSARERRLLLLLALVASIAGIRALWLVATSSSGAGAGSRSFAAGQRGGRARGAARNLPATLVELRSDLLESTPRPFEVGRDLFRFAPPPPPPGPTPEELERLRRLAEERQQAARAAAREPATPRPPEITVRFLGSFGPDDAKIAVFTARSGTEVLNARVGDVLEEKFIVDRIGFESVDLRFVGFPDVPARRLPVGG